MINVETLKNKILSMALHGKLSEQLDTDSPCSLQMKVRDIKPNDGIPTSWIISNIGMIADIRNGFTPDRSNESFWENGTVPWFTIEDKHNQGNLIYETKQHITSIALTKERLVPADSVLLCCTASVGEIAFSKIELTTNQQFNALTIKQGQHIDPMYLFYFACTLKSILNNKLANSTTFGFVSKKKVSLIELPIPPIEEQKRIVAKLDEIFAELDKIDEKQTRLQTIQEKMESKILKLAIQGKLVEQRPEEGTGEELFKLIQHEKQELIKQGKIKKEKPLPAIEESEIPFEIPSTWKWVRIGQIFNHSAGKSLNSSDTEGTKYTYITTSNVYWNKFILSDLKSMYYKENELEKCSTKKGDLLVLEGGDIGRAAIWNYDYDMRIQNHIHRLRPLNGVTAKFYYYLFFLYKTSNLIDGRGIGLQGLSANKLKSIVMPLPPYEEQKRIVTKIEELLPLCRGN